MPRTAVLSETFARSPSVPELAPREFVSSLLANLDTTTSTVFVPRSTCKPMSTIVDRSETSAHTPTVSLRATTVAARLLVAKAVTNSRLPLSSVFFSLKRPAPLSIPRAMRTTVDVSETSVPSLMETETATVEFASTRLATEVSNSSTTSVPQWISLPT